jgi:hypothetical protein
MSTRGGSARQAYPRWVQGSVQPSQAPRCNIGAAEIRRRQLVAGAITATTVGIALALLALDTSPLARLAIWPFAGGAAIAWLQVVHRFCVRFGIGGIQNLGELGDERPVERGFLEADRWRSWQLIGQGLLIGLVVAVVFANLPI